MVDIPDDATTTAVLEFDASATVGTYSGRFEFGGDRDWIQVTLQASVTYHFFLASQFKGFEHGDSLLQLRNTAGAVVASNDNNGGGGGNSFIQFTPTSSGTYYIDASIFNQFDTGSYSVLMTRVAAANVFGSDVANTVTVNAGQR